MKIAVTGSTGFIGRNLIDYLLRASTHEVVALSRAEYESFDKRVTFKKADLYSLLDCERALEGCDVGIYLVHSMAPSFRLSQGSFQDFDFILADNFAKAAEKMGLKRILYISGIIPDFEELSLHLKSRLEVEDTLKAHKTPVLTLRCGLVIGKNGSSFNIVDRLVKRLPVMGLPSWTKTEFQCIYVKDLMQIMGAFLEKRPFKTCSYDVGAPERIPYQGLLKMVGKNKSKKIRFVHIPFITPTLSKLWVRLITQLSAGLIYPLIDSLKHKMTVDSSKAIPQDVTPAYTPLERAVALSLGPDKDPSLPAKKKADIRNKPLSRVQSVQRLPCPEGWTMHEVAQDYMQWLPRFLGPFFKVSKKGDLLYFQFRLFSKPLLIMRFSEERTFEGRELFYIEGGLLNIKNEKARFEFRVCPDKKFFIAAIHNYQPSLPWYVYKFSQAPFHAFVMKMFGRRLSRITSNKL